jgi:uncharacterized protein (PEP-CTERM system associated)
MGTGTDMGMSNRSSSLLGMLLIAAGAVDAQQYGTDISSKRTVTIVPRVVVSETFTNNVRLASSGQQSEQITEVSPGIRLSIDGARLKTYLDYSLSEVMYAQNTSSRRSQNALNTFGVFEALDNWAFVDFSSSISRQAISAFGTQSNSNTAINANQTEVSSYRLSPYIRGRLGAFANYDARYSRSLTQSDATVASGTATAEGAVKINGGSSFASLGWTADLSQQNIDYSAGRPTQSGNASLGLTYFLSPQANAFATAGREFNNFTTIDKEGYATNSIGLNWQPSEMTKASASRSQRSFGQAHSLTFQHRTARTAWTFSDLKDVSATPSQTGIVSVGSVYDLLFIQFSTLEPNPVLRAQLVNAYLQAANINPTAPVTTNALTSAVSLLRRQDISFALLGVRDTITFIGTQSKTSRLDVISTALDDLSASSVLRQHGFSVNYAHRLTPDYSLGVLVSQQNTSGSLNTQESSLKSLNVSLTGKVGSRASATVSARRVVSGSHTAPYGETAITGNINVQF